MTWLIIKKIVKEHQNSEHNYRIKWAIQLLKSLLNNKNKRKQVEFSKWAIKELNNKAIFIFSDETYYKIDEHFRKKQKFFWSEDILS